VRLRPTVFHPVPSFFSAGTGIFDSPRAFAPLFLYSFPPLPFSPHVFVRGIPVSDDSSPPLTASTFPFSSFCCFFPISEIIPPPLFSSLLIEHLEELSLAEPSRLSSLKEVPPFLFPREERQSLCRPVPSLPSMKQPDFPTFPAFFPRETYDLSISFLFRLMIIVPFSGIVPGRRVVSAFFVFFLFLFFSFLPTFFFWIFSVLKFWMVPSCETLPLHPEVARWRRATAFVG